MKSLNRLLSLERVLLLLTVLCGQAIVCQGQGHLGTPNFVGQIENVTVTAGRDAVLKCKVENLKGYKVAWVQVDSQTILTIHNIVITRNPRVGISHEGQNVFRLHLKSVAESDRGWYMCQINTDPMIKQLGFLQVVVPPDFEDSAVSGDLVIREGSNVSLECRARGYPHPKVTWRRQDPENRDKDETVWEGEVLYIPKVSRLHMGTYMCVASNGIQPTVSRMKVLKVQFPPMLWIPNQLEGAKRGESAVLECNTEAYPRSINYWTNHRGEMIADAGPKYDTLAKEETYKTYMRLTIHNVTSSDFTSYKCIAKNSLGETDGVIKLYDIDPSISDRSTSAATVPNTFSDGAADNSFLGESFEGQVEGEEFSGRQVARQHLEGNYFNTAKNRYEKQLGKGRRPWNTADSTNTVYSEMDEIFREKEESKSRRGKGKKSPFDLSIGFDSGTSTLKFAAILQYLVIWAFLLAI